MQQRASKRKPGIKKNRRIPDNIKKRSLPVNNYHQSLEIAAWQFTERQEDFGYCKVVNNFSQLAAGIYYGKRLLSH